MKYALMNLLADAAATTATAAHAARQAAALAWK